jgi:hypothetical protein
MLRLVGGIAFWAVGVLLWREATHVSDRRSKKHGTDYPGRLDRFLAGLVFALFFAAGLLTLAGISIWSKVGEAYGRSILFTLVLLVGIEAVELFLAKARARDHELVKLKIKPKRKHTPDDSSKRKHEWPEE